MAKPKRSTKAVSEGQPAKATRPKEGRSYGEASSRLDEILIKIEEGDVDIDELSGLVAEAAELVTLCREKIQAAEVQVQRVAEQLERELPSAPEDDEDDDDEDDDDEDANDDE